MALDKRDPAISPTTYGTTKYHRLGGEYGPDASEDQEGFDNRFLACN